MASTQIQTTNRSVQCLPNAKQITRAGSRLWAIVCGGSSGTDTGVNLFYSDNDGGTWTKPTGGDLDASTGTFVCSIDAQQVASTWELHCCWAATAQGADWTTALSYANVLSNVDTGTPGTVTVSTVDAGGTALGVSCPSLAITPTASNPKVWIVANKSTATGPVVEHRAWRAPATTASPSWTSYTNINSTSSNDASGASKKGGTLAYWTVGGAGKLTILVKKPTTTPGSFDAFTFDPSVTSPVLGTATNVTDVGNEQTSSFDSSHSNQEMAVCAKADYLVFWRHRRTSGTVDFYKTVNGTSWSNPTGWTALTMGNLSMSSDGTDIWAIHGSTFGAVGTTVTQLQYRKITTSSDTLGGTTNFSDTNGNPVSVPASTGTSKFYGLYLSATSSPYAARSDFVSIGGAADTTPPGSASVAAVPNIAGAEIDLTATMPADIDVAQYEIRFLTSGYPASNRSNGTVIVSPTATSANAQVVFSHTSLSNGTRYFYSVFVKDTAGNWNTGAQVTAVASTPVSFLQRYQADGTTTVPDGLTVAGNNPVLVWQLAAANFESGKVSHFRLRTGNDQAAPPTNTVIDYVSSSGGSVFQYEDPAGTGTWVDVPTSGLVTTFFARKLRVKTGETGASRWCSIRVEQ